MIAHVMVVEFNWLNPQGAVNPRAAAAAGQLATDCQQRKASEAHNRNYNDLWSPYMPCPTLNPGDNV